MRTSIRAVALVLSLLGHPLFAQTAPEPPAKAALEVVRVRTGNYAGMCIGRCDTETSIDSKAIVTVSRSPGDPDTYPEQKAISPISKKDWREVQALVDAPLLAALDTPLKQCPGCADEPVQWVKVEFKGGTVKGIGYNEGTGPRVVSDFLAKLGALERRPRPTRFEGPLDPVPTEIVPQPTVRNRQ